MATDSIPSLLTTPGGLASSAIRGVAAVAPVRPAAANASSDTAAPTATAPAAPSVLQTAVASAAGSQAGLAGLLADLTSALQSQALPADVQAAAAQILDAQLALDPPPTAETLRQAVGQSGLFLEAQLAATGAPPDGDLKAALLTLIQALDPDVGSEVGPAGAGATGAGPPPPYAGAPLQGQPPAAALLAPEAALEMVAALLSRDAKGALARQVLMQAASLPKSGQTAATQTSAQRSGPASWLFELLFAAPDGPAVAQFEIDRDGDPPKDGAPDPIWRVRFSLNFAPIGPIHARISLSGGQAHVALWAENDDTRSMLDAHQADLADALAEDEMTPHVAVFHGRPNVAPAAAGQFMNRAV
jgi:hypothetical protein